MAKMVPLADWRYNTTFHSSTWTTPYEVANGVSPPTLLTYVPGTTKVQAGEDELRDKDQALKLLKENLQKAQMRMKQNADKHRSKRNFEVGYWVYLRLQPYRQNTIAVRKSQKLSVRYYGPFLLLQKGRVRSL